MSSSVVADQPDLPVGSDPNFMPREGLITRERYTSDHFMQLEADHVWARVWNIGGRLSEIPAPGDFITHALGKDSIIMARHTDGKVRAFHNVCPHRGNRLVYTDAGSVDAFTCSYHGWKFTPDGTLVEAQDPDDFPQGNPCGKLGLSEIPCEVWAGFIWYNMDRDCESLSDFLGEVKDLLEPYRIDRMTRVYYKVAEIPCNYKCIHDNFCESYHLPETHPEISAYFDDDYKNTVFQLFDTGHNLMRMKGALPSLRNDDPNKVNPMLVAELDAWDMNPADFEGRTGEARGALHQQKRKLGPERGFDHFPGLLDEQLTDPFHFNIFPGTSVTLSCIGLGLQRAEPHPSDPNKCIYEHWQLVIGPNQDGLANGPSGPVPFQEAERDDVTYGVDSLGNVADQDLRVASGQQLGFQSRGFEGAYLTGQESRVQQFHECLDDYIARGEGS